MPSSLSSRLLDLDQKALSTSRRKVLICVGALESLLTSAVVLGWAPLKVILQREGVYEELCHGSQSACLEQEDAFAKIYTVGAVLFGVAVWPMGMLLDKCGPRFTILCGAVLSLAGALIFAFSGKDALLGNMFCVGYALMAFGGPGIAFSMMHLSNLFPSRAGTILVIFNVTIDASSIVFAIFEVISRWGFSYQTIFVGYSIVPMWILCTGPCFWAEKQYEEPSTPNNSAPLRHLTTFWEIVKTPEYVCGLIYTCAQMYLVNVYIGTINDSLHKRMTKPYSLVGPTPMSVIFGWTLPVGGILACFFVGKCIDHFTLATNVGLLSILTVLYSGLNFGSEVWAIFLSFAIFAYSRATMFGTMCAYVPFVFGFAHFGKIWGSMELISGLTCLGVPYIDDLINRSNSLIVINAFLTSLAVATLLMPIWMNFRKTFLFCRRPSGELKG